MSHLLGVDGAGQRRQRQLGDGKRDSGAAGAVGVRTNAHLVDALRQEVDVLEARQLHSTLGHSRHLPGLERLWLDLPRLERLWLQMIGAGAGGGCASTSPRDARDVGRSSSRGELSATVQSVETLRRFISCVLIFQHYSFTRERENPLN